MGAYGGVHLGEKKQKSQARATLFLVLFMLLVPTVLAIGYTGSITGDIASNEAPPVTIETIDADAYPQADVQTDISNTENNDLSGQQEYGPNSNTEPATISESPQEDPQQSPEEQDPSTEEEPEQPPELLPEDSIDLPQDQDPTDPCEEVECNDVTEKCPDGYEASCSTGCDPDTGACSSCSPDCAGHELPEEAEDPEEPEQQPEQNETDPEPEQESGIDPEDLCDGIVCADVVEICPDGFEATCISLCNPLSGNCDPCQPDCSDHQVDGIGNVTRNETDPGGNETEDPDLPELPELCNITCGDCEILDEENCTCFPDIDCQTANDTDTFECTADIDCNDDDICTSDSCLNGTCQYQSIIPCCGNGICEGLEGETFDTCPDDCNKSEIPEKPKEPFFSISVDWPARVTRGSTIEFSATLTNQGTGTAFNVRPYWFLPEGLQLISTDNDCDSLPAESYCTITGQIYIQPETIGRKEIMIMVDYE